MDTNEVVRKLAVALFEFQKKFEARGACYLINYFMKWFLHKEFNLEIDVKCGFIYNQSDDLYGFHAWSVFENKQVDVAGYFPMSEHAKRANVIILDEIYERGEESCVYTLDDTLAEAKLKANFGKVLTPVWIYSKQEQNEMRNISHDLDAIYHFVSKAPYFDNLLNEVRKML